MSSITSWGILTVVICDFAFFAPVAIGTAPYVRCMSVYGKKIIKKDLRCISFECSVYCIGDIHHAEAKPGSVSSTCRASNHNVTRTYIMACLHDTQTRPAKTYLWRFIALKRTDLKSVPCRLSVEAATERDARRILAPHFILSLAARLPLQGGVKITMHSTIEEISTPSTVSKIEMEVRHA
ncbi:host cell division inhibitor Icd-like protein [Serratia marcescens]|uniref:host cell division inhibitor Icd-like protein n=1 Tax=Serratia marcescens TaxID=615 RepID=UPI003D77C85A